MSDVIEDFRAMVAGSPHRPFAIYPSEAVAILEYVDSLTERLEITPDARGYDGIYCRDETIKLLDARIEKLLARIKDLESENKETLDPTTIGPRTRTAQYRTCAGCPSLRTQWWKEYLDDDETESGTSAECCAAKNRTITEYWNDTVPPPAWCPAINKEDEGR